MDRHTGRAMGGADRRRQSIHDILMTRIGSRVCRREYGSLLPDLIDSAVNAAGVLRIYAATALAIARWEPEFRLTRARLARADEQSGFVLTLDGIDAELGRAVTIPIALTA